MNSTSLFTGSLQLLALLALEVTLICLAVALLARRARSASWRRVFWQAGLFAILVVTACELTGTGRILAGWALGTSVAGHGNEPVSRAEQNHPQAPQLDPEFRSRVEARLAVQRLAGFPRETSTPQPQHPTEVPLEGRAMPVQSRVQPPQTALPVAELGADSLHVLWLWLVWATGTLLVAARAWIGRCLLLIFRARRRQVADPQLLARVCTLSQALGFRRRVRLVESDRLRGPIAFGLLRPTIGLPRDFSTRFGPEQQEAMLAHELAHLSARDPVWSLLADSCAALLWWHPAVWWVRRQFHLATELAADEASLLLQDGPAVLAECLLEMGARLAGHRSLGQLQVSGFRSHLGRRVQQLLHLKARPWSPPPRLRAALLLTLGPLTLAALVVVCTAWTTPRALTKGNTMQSMQLSLKRSLATLALLAAVNAPEPTAVGAEAATPPSQSAPSGSPATAVNGPAPGSRAEQEAAMERFRRRYGLDRPLSAPTTDNPKRQKIETKLNELILPQVHFDGIPLGEVIKMLSDQAVKLDPEKKGINFLINPNTTAPAPGAAVDPSTGLPLQFVPQESVDVSAIMVKFSLPLRNVSLREALDAVAKVAERNIEYTVEDYGVVISLKPVVTVGGQLSNVPATPEPEPLVAFTFKVDTNTFLVGLETAFDIKVAQPPTAKERAREIQSALKALLGQLGVGGKSIFYNELTGIIMVRASASDHSVIQAAMETLGGTPVGSYGATGLSGVYGVTLQGGGGR